MSDVFQSLWDAPLSRRGTLRVSRGDCDVRLVGMEHGVLSIVEMQSVPGLGVTLLLHEQGRQYWASRGRQGYAGASMRTVLIEAGAGPSFRYVELMHSSILPNVDARVERTLQIVRMLLDEGLADPSRA